MHAQRGLDPAGRNHPATLPLPAVGDHLAEFGQVAAAVAGAAAAHADAFGRAVPLRAVDPERLFQRLVRERLQRLAAGALDHRAEQETAGGAVRERAPVRAVLRPGHPRREALDRQPQHEAGPVLAYVHAFLVAVGKRVFVVAVQQRAHGQQVFDGDAVLARVGVRPRALVGEVAVHAGLGAGNQAAVDGRADQQGGDAFARRAHVVEHLGAALVEIGLVDQLALVRHQHAGHLRVGALGDGGFELAEAFDLPAPGGGIGHGPAVVARLRRLVGGRPGRHGEQGEQQGQAGANRRNGHGGWFRMKEPRLRTDAR